MRKYLLFVAFLITVNHSGASSIPFAPSAKPSLAIPVDPLHYFSTLSMKEVQKLAGRKLKIKEKIGVKILQWKIKKAIRTRGEPSDKGRTAKIFGIVGLASIFIPVIGIFSAIVCGLLAVILGYEARKADPGNKDAKTGIVLGWITLGLIVLAVIIVIGIIASWSFGWG